MAEPAQDQAESLRKLARRSGKKANMQVFSITSGKGGVGKTSLICNIAARLGQLGHRVLLIDADLGLANVDILLGLTPRSTLEQLFRGERTLEQILLPGPPGVTILPSGSGVKELTHLSDVQIMTLMTALDEVEGAFDILLIDTGAGIGKNVLDFNAAAQDVLVVTNPEPTAITDAYAIIKVLARDHGVRRFQLIVNEVKTPRQGIEVYRTITSVSDQHMADVANLNIEYLGHVLRDETVSRAVLDRRAFVLEHPDAPATTCVHALVERMVHMAEARPPTGNMQFFWRRLLQQSAG